MLVLQLIAAAVVAAVALSANAAGSVVESLRSARDSAAFSSAMRVWSGWGDITVTGVRTTTQFYGSDANTDDSQHWLREHFRSPRAAAWDSNKLPPRPTAVVGATGIAANNNRPGPNGGEQYLHPQVDPLLTAAQATLYAAVVSGSGPYALLHAHAAWWAALAAGNALNGPVVANNELANCDPSVIQALAHAGNGNGNERACAIFALNAHGGNGNCPAGMTLADIKAITSLISNANANIARCAAALRDHYARATALGISSTTSAQYDMWCVEGTDGRGGVVDSVSPWLYTTQRNAGHRLRGALGFVGSMTPQAAEQGDLDRQYIRQTQHGGVATRWGRQYDTVGHVRPRMFSGPVDPLNFVPQSDSTQKIGVGPAEDVLKALRDQCPAVRLRYGLVFTYANGDHVNGRRPTQTRTVIDIADDCTQAGAQSNTADDDRLGTVQIALDHKQLCDAVKAEVDALQARIVLDKATLNAPNDLDVAKNAADTAKNNAATAVNNAVLALTNARAAAVNTATTGDNPRPTVAKDKTKWGNADLNHKDGVFDLTALSP